MNGTPPVALPRNLLVFAALLLAWIYGYRFADNPLKWEEPRRCLVAMEMIHLGDYIAPRLLGEPYRNKPPLQNWLIVLISGNRFDHVGAVAVRRITLLALVCTAFGLWRAGLSGRVSRPDPRPALIWLTLGIVIQFGRAGEIDVLFTAWVASALLVFEFGRRRGAPWLQWCVPQLVVALGVLTKWLAPLLFYPPVLWLAWRRRRQVPWAPLPFLAGLVGMLAIVAAWLVPLFVEESGAVLGRRLLFEAAGRTVDEAGSIGSHMLQYPFALLGIALPWTLLPLFVRRGGWSALRREVGADPWLGLCVAVVAWTAFVFFFVAGLRERYLIPATPLLAVSLAALLHHVPVPAARRTWQRWIAWGMLGLAFATALAISGVDDVERPIQILWPALAGVAALLATGLALRDTRRPATPVMVLLLALLYGVYIGGAHEFREAGRNRIYAEIAERAVPAIDAAAVVVDVADREERKLAWELAHRLGRPVRRNPPAGEAYWWVGSTDREPPAASRPVLVVGRFALRRVDDPSVEAWALTGEPLRPPPLDAEVRERYEIRLDEARERVATAPDRVESWIWLGRRTAYLGRYGEAIAVYTAALELFPDEPRLYRHRGHRFITVRRLERAIADLERAAGLIAGTPDRIEPDGLPNAAGIPTSTLHSNVWYHLGLARYLRGDFAAAADAYREGLEVATNPDMFCATTHWLYMALRRIGHTAEVAALLEPVHAGMRILENRDYHRLLLIYRGEADPATITAGASTVSPALAYGLANRELYSGRRAAARAGFRRIVEGARWADFGHIAAEADLARDAAD